MKTLGTIQGSVIQVRADGVIDYVAKAAIDSDGSDNRHHDPCWQPETSLKLNGKSIDAESVAYVVVPPLILLGVPGIILGCACRVTNTETGKTTLAVVADQGPARKLGELSCQCAREIGLDGNPNHGGTDAKIIRYEIHPDEPALVNGVRYELQAHRG